MPVTDHPARSDECSRSVLTLEIGTGTLGTHGRCKTPKPALAERGKQASELEAGRPAGRPWTLDTEVELQGKEKFGPTPRHAATTSYAFITDCPPSSSSMSKSPGSTRLCLSCKSLPRLSARPPFCNANYKLLFLCPLLLTTLATLPADPTSNFPLPRLIVN